MFIEKSVSVKEMRLCIVNLEVRTVAKSDLQGYSTSSENT